MLLAVGTRTRGIHRARIETLNDHYCQRLVASSHRDLPTACERKFVANPKHTTSFLSVPHPHLTVATPDFEILDEVVWSLKGSTISLVLFLFGPFYIQSYRSDISLGLNGQ